MAPRRSRLGTTTLGRRFVPVLFPFLPRASAADGPSPSVRPRISDVLRLERSNSAPSVASSALPLCCSPRSPCVENCALAEVSRTEMQADGGPGRRKPAGF
ncbi:unnamed protein product [Pleuronectes platessa]|uniref:Uncharacterized protein n=1 Tax=Pleuronectes platessa TaxID=8262 RepID=A0A9N7UKA1_PLEPL|nr:unnamed protein product [Pleuronectes platessa]